MDHYIIPFSDGEMLQDRPGRAVPSIGALVFTPSVCLAETIRPLRNANRVWWVVKEGHSKIT